MATKIFTLKLQAETLQINSFKILRNKSSFLDKHFKYTKYKAILIIL